MLLIMLFIFFALPITYFVLQHVQKVQETVSPIHDIIYEDALASGWKARSVASRINLANTAPVYAGSKSISFTPTRQGGRLYLYTTTLVNLARYSSLHFAARASQAGQDYNVMLYDGTNKPLPAVRLAHYGGDPPTGTWKVYTIPSPDLGANATQISGVAFQSRTNWHGTLYLDSIALPGAVFLPTPTVTATPTFTPTPVPQLTPTTGKNLYVSPSGSNSNDGSQTHPFATITKAASHATPGTTVHVAPGIYTQPVSTDASGTSTARITYVSDTKWAAKIQLSRSAAPDAIWSSVGDYVTIQGFDISGGSGFNGILYEGNYVQISGNRVHDLGTTSCYSGAGINNNGYTIHDDNIIGNIVYNIGPKSSCNQIHGIYYSNLKAHISNNITYNNAGYGIQCWHACNKVIIDNNLVFGNRFGGIIIGAGDAPGGVVTNNSIIANNIAINNIGYGIREYEYPGSNTIGSKNQILKNIVYGNTVGGISLLNGNTASGTITSHVQFVNFQADGSGDYHLKPKSPAIDAGTSIGAPTDDIDGVPRPQGKGYDIGPYEYRP